MSHLRQNKIPKLIARKSLFYRTIFFSLVHYKDTVIQESTPKLLKTAFHKLTTLTEYSLINMFLHIKVDRHVYKKKFQTSKLTYAHLSFFSFFFFNSNFKKHPFI